mgnify:FL=1|jgi:hypothetical protein
MKTVKKKIGFYYLVLKDGDLELPAHDVLIRLFVFLTDKTRLERKLDIAKDKIVFLDTYTSDEVKPLLKLRFKSAKHSYRAPLIDKNTVEERDNPKRFEEGEQMKTHALIKFKDGYAFLFLETGSGVLTSNNLKEYLNQMLVLYNKEHSDDELLGHFSLQMIPCENFRDVLQSMTRVSCAEIYTEKRILGSDALNFSDPTDELREEVVVSIKAERKKSIARLAYRLLDKFSGGESVIRRIRVKGKMSNNNDSIIDTGFLLKKEYVDVLQDDETGQLKSANMFSKLVELSDSV